MMLILLTAMLLWGCPMEPGDQASAVSLLSGTATGCLNTKSSVVSDDEELYVVRNVGDRNYRIEHQNASFNCCLQEGIAFTVEMQHDTLFFGDYEKIAGNCKCMCTYHTSAEIGEIEEGTYCLVLTTGEQFVGSVQLNFKPDMYVEIPVSDLIESL